MCYEIGDLGKILEMKQSIDTILNDDNFGVLGYEPEAMGLIYEASVGKLMNEGSWKQAAAAFQQSTNYFVACGSLKAKQMLKYELLTSIIAKNDMQILMNQLQGNIFLLDPDVQNLCHLYKGF